MKRISALALLVTALVALPALAADDKGGKKKQDVNIDDLFGAPPPKQNLDAMKKATEGVNTKAKTGTGLDAKVGTVDNDAGVQLLNVFAAETITQDKKLGCQAGGRDKKKIGFWTFDEVPSKGQPFEVCLTLASKAGREMNMSVAVVDSRNQRIAKAEDVVDFRGRPKIDHVLAYPAPLFKLAGQYFYVVDLDGKEVGRLPLFTVKLDGDASASAPASDAPVTAADPGDGE